MSGMVGTKLPPSGDDAVEERFGGAAPTRRFTVFELAWVPALCLAGAVLRAWHLGTPSLWWDEIIHLGTAWQKDAWTVFRQAKLGIPPGFGNAGAVPLDYLVLHAYLQLVPQPGGEHVEAYFRAPSWLASTATPLLLWWWTRRNVGRGVALVAATLLAFSIPHVLYAVEVRSYSLFTLMTVVHLAAFTRLLDTPSAGRWVVFGLVSVAYFLTGLLGLLVVAITYLVLAVRVLAPALRRRARWLTTGRQLGMLGGAGLLVAGAVYAYFLGTQIWVTSRRTVVPLDPVGTTLQALSYYLLDSRFLFALLLLSVAVIPAACARGPRRLRAIVMIPLLLMLAGVIPAIVELERRKHYYFHVRHALFLLPALCVVVAATFDTLLRWLDPLRPFVAGRATRRAATVAIELAAVLAVCAPAAGRYVARPDEFFAHTKTLRDVQAFTRALRATMAEAAPEEKMLVLVEHFGPGFLANPALALYLRWYGLEDRVVLRGSAIPASTLRRVADLCASGCRGQDGAAFERQVLMRDALAIPPFARELLRLEQPTGSWPGRLRSVVVVTYSPIGLGPWAEPLHQQVYTGLTSWQPAGDAMPAL